MRDFFTFLENLFKELTKKENLGPRIFAVVTACLLWVYVSMDQNPITERVYEVPLRQADLPATMTVYNVPEKISVRVRGSRTLMNEKFAQGIHARVDFKNVTEGQQKVPVRVSSEMGEILSIAPAEVSVYVDTVSEKSVPVQTRMVGAAPEDMTMGNISIKPNTVTIKGATHRIDKVNRVVAPVDVTDREGSFEAESELVGVSDDGYDIPNMVIAPQRVVVSAVMVPQMLTVELPVELVTVGNPPAGMVVKNLSAEPAKVRLSAPPSRLKGLTAIKTKPLDVSRLISGATPAVELELPERALPELRVVKVNVELLRADSETVRESTGNTSDEMLLQAKEKNRNEAKN